MKKNDDNLENIKKLIAANEYLLAIQDLQTLTKELVPELYNETLLHFARFNSIAQDERKGLLNRTEATQERLRIQYAVTDLVDEISLRLSRKELSGTFRYRKEDEIIKILFLCANPSKPSLNLDKEVSRIQTNMELAKEREHLIFTTRLAVTIDILMQAVLNESPEIIHFSGHGLQQGIILQDEMGESKLVQIDALANLFKLFRESLKCVILNSCYSENQAKAIKLHIPYVIGMRGSIPDSAAIAFSVGFYKAIGAGKNIPFAFDLGVTAIQLQGIAGDNLPILL